MRAHRFALIALLGFVPLACSPSDDTAITFSAQNAPTAADQGFDAADFLTQMGELANIFTPVIGGGAQTAPCDSSNMTVAVNDVAPVDQLSTGDNGSITFNACVFQIFNQTMTLNGTLILEATEITGGPEAPYSAAFTVTYQSLSLNAFGITWIINGSFTLASNSADGDTVVNSVSGPLLSGYVQGPQGNSFSGTVQEFNLQYQLTESNDAFVSSLDGIVSGSALPGTLTYATQSPFVGTEPNDPDAGSLMVTSSNGSSLTLIALDNVNVELQIDTDGDGQTDITINTTWDQLEED